MKSLFAKILAAQVIAVVLALLVVAGVTRFSLQRGFIDFLERQEAAVLSALAPALAGVYDAQGGWSFLVERPGSWHRILRQAREVVAGESVEPPPRGPFAGRGRAGEAGLSGQELRWLRSFDRLQLRDRLFLLDGDRRHLAGASTEGAPGEKARGRMDDRLEAVVVDGETVGWIGFRPLTAAGALPPEAARFLQGQVRVMLISLGLAVALASLLAYLLARYLSRPLHRLDRTVLALAEGRFEQRAEEGGAAELARLARNVNTLAVTLEHNQSARRRWIADIAHELRTPLAILKGEVEALADGVRAVDAQGLASLMQEIAQLTHLVDDLQTLALADAGALELRREPLDLAALLSEVAESFRERLAQRRIGLDLATAGPVPVVADAGRLRRLLQNLLENCARYTVPGGTVRASLSAAGGRIELVVEDSGPGVPAQDLDRLFERFYRIEQGRSRASGGSGLGLSICRNIAEAHGGSIRAERSALGGLSIVLSLPAGEASR